MFLISSGEWTAVGIILVFFILFCLLMFGDLIYDTLTKYYTWLKPYAIIFLGFGVMVYLVYPSIPKLLVSIVCVIVILYAFRLTYHNKYIKGFKTIPKEPKSIPEYIPRPKGEITYGTTDKNGFTVIHTIKKGHQ